MSFFKRRRPNGHPDPKNEDPHSPAAIERMIAEKPDSNEAMAKRMIELGEQPPAIPQDGVLTVGASSGDAAPVQPASELSARERKHELRLKAVLASQYGAKVPSR